MVTSSPNISSTKTLGFRGYSLVKKEWSDEILNKCRKDLIVSPFIPGEYGMNVPQFPVYLESKTRLYLPS